jgi:hypothetical protein
MSVAVQHSSPLRERRALLWRVRLLQVRLWSERIVRGAARGLCFGLAIALGGAVALVAQSGIVLRENLILVVVLGLLAGVLFGLARPPSLLTTARAADARYGLEARVGTAVELLRLRTLRRGRFGEAQLADAAGALSRARGGWPLPGADVWREAMLALTLTLALLLALRLEGQGPSLLERLPLAPTEVAVVDAPGGRESLAPPPAAAGTAPRVVTESADPRTSAALRTLDELRRSREAGTLSPQQAQAALDQIEAELGQSTADARQQRETLDRLARALSQVSAGEAAAESIERGDYAQAAEQLRQLGEEADQLSTDAKAQLSQALRRAATESGANPPLAERERRAAEALAGRDYQAAQSALEQLGSEVARGDQQTASQSELAAAMQRLQEERTANAAPSGSPAMAQAGQPGADQQSASPAGAAGGSQAGTGEGNGQGSGGGEGDGQLAESGSRPAAPDGPAEKNADQLGDPAPRLDVAGQQVDVPARPGAGDERGLKTDRPGEQEQVTDRAQSASDATIPAVPVQAGGLAERVVVPGDQRQVVRDYFGRRGSKGAP